MRCPFTFATSCKCSAHRPSTTCSALSCFKCDKLTYTLLYRLTCCQRGLIGGTSADHAYRGKVDIGSTSGYIRSRSIKPRTSIECDLHHLGTQLCSRFLLQCTTQSLRQSLQIGAPKQSKFARLRKPERRRPALCSAAGIGTQFRGGTQSRREGWGRPPRCGAAARRSCRSRPGTPGGPPPPAGSSRAAGTPPPWRRPPPGLRPPRPPPLSPATALSHGPWYSCGAMLTRQHAAG